MELTLPGDSEEIIQRLLRTGAFRTPSEVIAAALAALERDQRRSRALAQLNAELERGRRDLEEGRFTEYTSANLADFLSDESLRGE